MTTSWDVVKSVRLTQIFKIGQIEPHGYNPGGSCMHVWCSAMYEEIPALIDWRAGGHGGGEMRGSQQETAHSREWAKTDQGAYVGGLYFHAAVSVRFLPINHLVSCVPYPGSVSGLYR